MGIDVRRALLHWAACRRSRSAEFTAPASILCPNVAESWRSTAEYSTPLPFPAQFACALFVLDIAGNGAKSVPNGQKQRQSCCKEDAQKALGATLAKVRGGVAWMELHAVLLLGLDTCAKLGFA